MQHFKLSKFFVAWVVMMLFLSFVGLESVQAQMVPVQEKEQEGPKKGAVTKKRKWKGNPSKDELDRSAEISYYSQKNQLPFKYTKAERWARFWRIFFPNRYVANTPERKNRLAKSTSRSLSNSTGNEPLPYQRDNTEFSQDRGTKRGTGKRSKISESTWQGDDAPKTERDPGQLSEYQGNKKGYGKRGKISESTWQGDDAPKTERDPGQLSEYQGNKRGYGKRGKNSESTWQGDDAPKTERDPGQYTQFKGNLKFVGKHKQNQEAFWQGNLSPSTKRDPSKYTQFRGNLTAKGKPKANWYSQWQGDLFPKPIGDPSVYTEWEGNLEVRNYGEPGDWSLNSDGNIKMKTNSLWRNVPGYQKRKVSKPTYDKSQKGMWAE